MALLRVTVYYLIRMRFENRKHFIWNKLYIENIDGKKLLFEKYESLKRSFIHLDI